MKTTAQVKPRRDRPSNIIVDSKGKLAYARPPFRKIAALMLREFPIMCWYMLIGMLLLFTRSLWAVMHPAVTVGNKADMLIYVFLMFVSASLVTGLVIGSYFISKEKLKTK